MQPIRRTASALALAALTFASGQSVQSAPVKPTKFNLLYATSFEAPPRFPIPKGLNLFFFKPGLLTGQNGFSAYGDNSIGAAKVVGGKASLGRQSVFVDGGRLTLFDGDFEGYYYPSFDYDPISQETPTLIIFCDVLYQPALKNEDYAGLGVYDIEGLEFATMNIGADGKLRFGSDELREVRIAPNRWQRLQMRLNFQTRTTRFYLNNRLLGSAPFGSDAGTRFGDADLLVENGDAPTKHKAFFDNYGIVATNLGPNQTFDARRFLGR